ncbi:MAG: 50S ribosomal protein L23 [Candidatus Melainabacteria bacterium]|nr:50S ribosomal protein L23 [Candidatus Melainabacteria bacterium]
MSGNLSNILLEPIITEKSTALSQHDKYTFKVAKDATKSSIKKAFQEIFPDKKVLSVKTLIVRGHKRRTKYGHSLPKDGKKAVVTASGSKITYFPEVS